MVVVLQMEIQAVLAAVHPAAIRAVLAHQAKEMLAAPALVEAVAAVAVARALLVQMEHR
jgi:hypothetical protein